MNANYHSATRISASHSLCPLNLTTTTLGGTSHYSLSIDEAAKVQRVGSENARELSSHTGNR